MKKYNINTNKYSHLNSDVGFISLFSGAGGLDIGVKLNKFNILSSLDNDKDSIETLKLNKAFSNTVHLCKDILNITATDYKSIIKNNNPKKLFLIGGPPCQPFSKAAYWMTHEKRLGHKSPNNMIEPYLNLIEELKPDGFILENVESILHPKNNDYIDFIKNKITKMGFNFKVFKLNSADYGVPQKRKRVFIVASSSELAAEIPQTHGNTKAIEANPLLNKYEKVFDWISEFDDEKYSDNYDSIDGKYKDDLISIIPGKNYIYLTSKYNHPSPKFIAGKRYWTFLLKLDPNQPSNTIISSPGHWEGPFHWNNRRLRIKELAAIQSFPNDYNFYGSRRSVIRQIGNAVPPLLAKKVVHYIVEGK